MDRVVVDILTEGEVGGLCENCLPSLYQPIFQDDIWHEDSGCAVCADEAKYHLPQIDCLIEYGGSRPSEIEYSIDGATVRLCTEHLEKLITDGSTTTPVAQPSITQ